MGAEFFAVGNGNVMQLNWFIDDQKPDFESFTDPSLAVYERAGFRRDLGTSLTPKLFTGAVRAFRKGHRQAGVKGDARQQGGVLVVKPDGTLVWRYVSNFGGDHPTTEAIMGAVREATGA